MRLLLAAIFVLLSGCASVGVVSSVKDVGYPMDAMSCFLLAQVAPSEIAIAKYYGVTKEHYLQKNRQAGLDAVAEEKARLEKDGKSMSAEREDKIGRFVQQYTYYLSEMWDSEDDGAQVINTCIQRSPEAKEKERESLKPSGMVF